jgi:phosphate starvation-inducible protein PhoH
MMDATMGAMVPMMGRMMEVMIEAQLKIAVLPGTAERIAIFKKNLYDALLKQGFTKDQATQLVVATGLPSASPSSK